MSSVSAGNGLLYEPLKNSGSIGYLEYVDVTPLIGREYPKAKLKDILLAPNFEQQLRDLAITICERGVVFFRARQDDLTIQEQKRITDLLGKLTRRPTENGLHVFPIFRDPNYLPMADGVKDAEIYMINTEAAKKMYKHIPNPNLHKSPEPRDLGREWHSDLLWERNPADFSFLRMESTAPTGGDTLWVNMYEIYDRISPSFRGYLETLTQTCGQPVLSRASEEGGYEIMEPRGSPLNVGNTFVHTHPLVRTHPVTGWKALFAGTGIHCMKINDVYAHEDALIRDYITRLITTNHDCIARMHWTEQAVAIWSNECTMHAATPDNHLVPGNRTASRSTGIGLMPYLDPNSRTRHLQGSAAPLVQQNVNRTSSQPEAIGAQERGFNEDPQLVVETLLQRTDDLYPCASEEVEEAQGIRTCLAPDSALALEADCPRSGLPEGQSDGLGGEHLNLDFLEDWVFPDPSPPSSLCPEAATATLEDDLPNSHLAQYRLQDQRSTAPASDELLVVVSEAELGAAEANLALLSAGHGLNDVSLPSRYAVTRYIRAYSRFCDPHAPIVPLQTFNISTAHPILILAVLSLGATYLDEADVSSGLFSLAQRLLARYDENLDIGEEDCRRHSAWELPARLLLCLYAALGGNTSIRRRANQWFATITDIVPDVVRDISKTPEESWTRWLEQQATIRCVAWSIVTAAMLQSLEGGAVFDIRISTLDVPLPGPTEEWTASQAAWLARKPPTRPQTTLCQAVHDLLHGRPVSEHVGSFGLLTVIAALQRRACSIDLLPTGPQPSSICDTVTLLDNALRLWEDSWRIHQQDSPSRAGLDPIMVDGLAILNSAYYNLVCGNQIRWMRRTVRSPRASVSPVEFATSTFAFDLALLERELVRAVRSLGLRARHGIKHINRIGQLRYAAYQQLSGAEGCFLFAWYSLGRKKAQPVLMRECNFPLFQQTVKETAHELRGSGIHGCDDVSTIMRGYEELLGGTTIWPVSRTLFEQFQTARRLLEESNAD
ncbi:Fungal specific transcription factor domain-containing protein [Cladophialophora immunda]|nr:Fungal specific transcription factor domain-containing protein [Cladophialophora immunda]